MIFEDAFTDKQSEIISLFKEVISDKVDTIYVFIHTDEWSSMETCTFGVDGKVLGNLEAGISMKIYLKYLKIEDEIVPELEELCKEHNKPMPQEFRYVYSVASGVFDAGYRYEEELSMIDDYDPGIEAKNWMIHLKDD